MPIMAIGSLGGAIIVRIPSIRSNGFGDFSRDSDSYNKVMGGRERAAAAAAAAETRLKSSSNWNGVAEVESGLGL